MATRGRILILDADAEFALSLRQSLETIGFNVLQAFDREEALLQIRSRDFDAALVSVDNLEEDGSLFGERCLAAQPGLAVIFMSASQSIEDAVRAIRAGAHDFLVKPVDVQSVALAVNRAVQQRSLRVEVKRLREAVAGAQGMGDLLGNSAPMRRVYETLRGAAASDATVMITGESGTGKDLATRAIHFGSKRSKGPYVAVNCAAVPENLLESELFGHAKGAFTDAHQSRAGLFLQADQGTIFLDEIVEMPAGMQAKLLRVLQERRVRAVGADREVPFNARVVAATNRDLEAAVEDGRFRSDLFFRLNVIRIEMPPLRARGSDILVLAQHLLERSAALAGKPVRGIAPRAAQRLLDYHWPGNVRELENCIERAVALTPYDHVTLDDLPARIRDYRTSDVVVASHDPSELVPLEEVEKRYILKVLASVQGNRSLAARILGLDRKTLYRKLERWEETRERQPAATGV